MLAQQTRPDEPPAADRAARKAALWATAVAVPVTVVVAVLLFSFVSERARTAEPEPAPRTPAALSQVPVLMPAPKLPPRAATICRAVLAKLPPSIRGLPQRPVTAGPEQNAAYGEPAVTLACGVEQPAMCPSLEETRPGCVPLDTELLTMNEVCWYAQQRTDGDVFTTMDREIAVRVTVPAGLAQTAQWANEFSDAVAATDAAKTDGVPSGCA